MAGPMFDVKAVLAEATREVHDEQVRLAKTKIVAQVKVLEKAKQVVANEQRVLDDLVASIGEGS